MAAQGNFDVATHRDDTAMVVVPKGEIDLATVDIVRDAVENGWQRGLRLVLDFREVGFMDTSGLRYVLELNDRAAREGFELRLVRGSSAVQRVFQVAGLDTRLPWVDEPDGQPASE